MVECAVRYHVLCCAAWGSEQCLRGLPAVPITAVTGTLGAVASPRCIRSAARKCPCSQRQASLAARGKRLLTRLFCTQVCAGSGFQAAACGGAQQRAVGGVRSGAAHGGGSGGSPRRRLPPLCPHPPAGAPCLGTSSLHDVPEPMTFAFQFAGEIRGRRSFISIVTE